MRKRAPLVGLVFAIGLARRGPVTAHAQEGEGELSQEQIDEIIHEAELPPSRTARPSSTSSASELVEGGRVDDCQEAPSPILPPPTSSSGGAVVPHRVPPDLEVRLARRSRRAWTPAPSGSAPTSTQAEAAKAEAEGVLAEYQAQLADAKHESARIIEEARQTADAMKRDLQAQAEAEIAAMRQKAAADIEAAKAQAIADLRGEVATLAIGAAEQVVERNLDRRPTRRSSRAYIDQVGAGRN